MRINIQRFKPDLEGAAILALLLAGSISKRSAKAQFEAVLRQRHKARIIQSGAMAARKEQARPILKECQE